MWTAPANGVLRLASSGGLTCSPEAGTPVGAQPRRRQAEPAEADLLARFIATRDENAFAELVRRHGGMVLGVSRRVLGHTQDAEDAFQAAFFVLARKAASVRPRAALASWLYGVAVRTALKARTARNRRRRREQRVAAMSPSAAPETNPSTWDDLLPVLDEELSRLPDKLRLPLVLCDLEGKSRREAARQLGWPEGSLSARLFEGRKKLARRLTRRGISLSAGALALLLAEKTAFASVPHSLAAVTAHAARLFAVGVESAAISAPANTLAQGVMKIMLLAKLKAAVATILAVVLIGSVPYAAGQAWATADGPGFTTEPVAADAADVRADAIQEQPGRADHRLADKEPPPQAVLFKAHTRQAIQANLLFNQSVQKELKLGDDQVKQLREIRADVQKKHEKALAEATEEAKKRNYEKYYKLKHQILEEQGEAVAKAKLLKPEQINRLEQIWVQRDGLSAFGNEEIAKALKLTDAQKQKLKTVAEEYGKELNKELKRDPSGNTFGPVKVEDYLAAEKKLLPNHIAKVVKEFSADQKKTWEGLVGAPFAYQFDPPGK